jgi:GWxTD domain-containing protein
MKIQADELLFVRQADDRYKAGLRVTLLKTYSYEANTPIDTAYCDFTFDMESKEKFSAVSCDFSHKGGPGTFLLRVILTDLNKNFSQEFFVPMETEGIQSRQFFKVTDINDQPVFRNFIRNDEPVRISFRDTLKKKIWCKYYNRDFPLAAPPFSFDNREGFNYKCDSLFEVDLGNNDPLKLQAPGFYHFQIDTGMRQGLTLFRFEHSFPQVTTPEQMLESVRYLTSKREYEEMLSNPSVKNAVDRFWMDRGGNAEKSKSLIRKYYSRVQEANEYFTSFVEGWRTDRGMLYIVLGVPNTVYRSSSTETWIYGTPNSTLALNFMFTRVNNPFSDNDLVLSRSPVYESNWYRAVETWRHGRAYNSLY